MILPLFPLEVVLFPNSMLALHIFEPRYLTLTQECIENKEPFGIVLFKNGQLYKTGCSAKVHQISKTYEDGRLDILVKGIRRFSINELRNDKIYLQGDITYLPDTLYSGLISPAQAMDEVLELFCHIQSTLGVKSDKNQMANLTPSQLSFLIGERGFLPKEERQQLLEIDDANERLTYILGLKPLILEQIEVQKKSPNDFFSKN